MIDEDIKSVLIVEDELLIAGQLKIALLNHGYLCAGIAINYNSAKAILETTKVDLVLLDIKISGRKTGLDVALLLNTIYGIPFLFITSYNDANSLHKIKELSPKGYINKPINEITVLTTIDIILNAKRYETKKFVSIHIGATTYNINLSELIYIEAEHVYVRLCYKTKKSLVRTSLTNIVELLPNESILRISRGIAINPKFIESVTSTSIKVNREVFKLSKKYGKDVENFLNI
ncbi:two component transcriptional regulator, LytTR family [Polaribacter sp. KT25b]|uniref:response regulator transcription factor n=1 Tax=Polaribacter sp. KT25b TaxID=1855336 RepID=UPI00087D694F|nr:response regulator transcription factor [Polaribacter sp. KT25b]SDS41322.1 two component transcriptional regulator, LytTR family [Polaribacter sp. KT25b]